jgi:hypothetical protein
MRPDAIGTGEEGSLSTDTFYTGDNLADAGIRVAGLGLLVEVFRANFVFVAWWDLSVISSRAPAALVANTSPSDTFTNATTCIPAAVGAVHNLIFAASTRGESYIAKAY